jgi:hypothetical protein
MSTSTTQYIITGVNLPIGKDDEYEIYEPFMDNGHDTAIKHKNGIAVIYDGFNGKFLLIGRIKHKSEMNQPLDGPYSFSTVGIDDAEMLCGLINLSFPNLKIEPMDINTWLVTKYH